MLYENVRCVAMKKTTITISYDEEKLNALKIYLAQKTHRQNKNLKKRSKPCIPKPCLQECVNLLT